MAALALVMRQRIGTQISEQSYPLKAVFPNQGIITPRATANTLFPLKGRDDGRGWKRHFQDHAITEDKFFIYLGVTLKFSRRFRGCIGPSAGLPVLQNGSLSNCDSLPGFATEVKNVIASGSCFEGWQGLYPLEGHSSIQVCEKPLLSWRWPDPGSAVTTLIPNLSPLFTTPTQTLWFPYLFIKIGNHSPREEGPWPWISL